ncbi:MAG: hypothetical protein HZA54_03850 [Planctomycetes bacterium]|nr:hypothetical protein [Planctomycetota bacterium]
MQVHVNGDSVENILAIGTALHRLVGENAARDFKAFVVFRGAAPEGTLKKVEELELTSVGWTVIGADGKDAKGKSVPQLYGLSSDASVKNTVFVYTGPQHTVRAKFVNLTADDLGKLEAAVKDLLK